MEILRYACMLTLAMVTGLAILATGSPARAAEPDFATWLAGLRADAVARDISPTTVDGALTGLAPIARVIELDRRQPEGTLTFAQYRTRIVSARRIADGRERLAKHGALFADVAARFGVQARFIVALWGIETSYGRITGGFPVIAALATLAHDGRRSAYFRRELLNALQILDEGHIALADMTGSWAGAMGQAQFMPSSFLAYATDHDGDGAKDIWSNKGDVFSSAANYLSNVGWRDDITWGREVRLPAPFDPALADLKIVRHLAQWQALGVRRIDDTDLPSRDIEASIVRPGGLDGPAYLVYDNYRALMKWNRSLYFATAVGLLSDRLAVGR